MDSLFEVFEKKAVLHGGTAIWRCYQGNRFSEDVDVYIIRNLEKSDKFFDILAKKGLALERKKISENSIYSSLKLENTIVRFEALFKSSDSILKEYEKADGNLKTVYTLSAEELIKEKVEAYLRRLKIRDLYDIFFLLRYAKEDVVKNNLIKLVKEFKEPIDEGNLKILILEGITPDKNKMLEYIKDYIKYGR